MATFEISLLSLFFIVSYLVFFFPRISADSIITCPKTSCLQGEQPVRFPFRLKNQPSECGYKGFSLSCDKHGRPILSLPYAGDFIVQTIEYEKQSVWINDPDNCLPGRFLKHEFNISNSPFSAYNYHQVNFTYLNCSSNQTSSLPFAYYSIDCLSSKDYKVYAIPTIYADPYISPSTVESQSPSPSPSSSCSVITTALIPMPRLPEGYLDIDIELRWEDPKCGDCEARDGICGFRANESNKVVACSVPAKSSSGDLSRAAKYGIILGAAIPGILCIVAFGSFVSGKVREYRQRRNPNFPATTTIDYPAPIVVVAGLDGPTIESYPKTLLGESRRLPRPNDNTCPICLSEYQPKDTLRTIPECNHYFHSNCVDEWLKMNATCPLCRNSPEASSAITPSSSVSSGTRSSSNSSSSLASQ